MSNVRIVLFTEAMVLDLPDTRNRCEFGGNVPVSGDLKSGMPADVLTP